MRRLPWFLALALTFPSTADAIQARWKSGASDLVFSSAVRCTLVVAADSAQVLPSQWHLVWGGTEQVAFVSVDSSNACGSSSAHSEHYDGPLSAVDTLAHLHRGYYCSTDPEDTPSAQIIIDLPASSRGKFKIVGLNTDGILVESGLATYNGGLSCLLPPTLLQATSSHEGLQLTISAVGANLGTVTSAQVGAPDRLWTLPLSIVAQTESTITASADVPSLLPEAVFQVLTSTGLAGEADIAADPQTMATVSSSVSSDTILFVDPNPKVYPKDFAFFYNSVPNPGELQRKGVFHLFYIRNVAASGLDSIIAHAWCDTLGGAWTVDSLAFRPSNLTWDKKKVWAPSIQQVGNRTYMFYTGVDSLDDQSIGYAWTDSLFTTNIPWHRNKAPVYRSNNTSWADTVGHEVANVLQFRDPFVMPDPDHPGRYLLFNSGEDRVLFPQYAIGVARNVAGTFNSWLNIGKYEKTDPSHLIVPGAIESPLVVRDSLTGAWRLFVGNADYDLSGVNSTYFITENVGDSLTRLGAAYWQGPDSLYGYLGNDNDLIGWQACEHLQIGKVHFFAAFNGEGIGITRMHWDPITTKFVFVYPTNASVGQKPAVDGVNFFLSELRAPAGVVRFVVDSPRPMTPRLVIYDLAGRAVQEVAAGQVMQGRREFLWNCRTRADQRVSSGMYFARLSGSGAAQILRVPIIK